MMALSPPVAATGDNDGKFLVDTDRLALFTLGEGGVETPLDRRGFTSAKKPARPALTRIRIGEQNVLFRLEGRNLAGIWLGAPADKSKTASVERELTKATRALGYDI